MATTNPLSSLSPRVRVSSSWFAKTELYDSCSSQGPIVIVNNSNDELSFGGGGTNGAIVRYFYPDRSTRLCGLLSAGRQHRDKWSPLTEVYPQHSGGNGGITLPVDMVPHPPGSIWYSDLQKYRRRGTDVSHIIHVVGPINDAAFAQGEDVEVARNRAANIVGQATLKILRFASTELKAGTVIISGISAGIFARGSEEWTEAMYNAMRKSISEYVNADESNSEVEKDQMEVVLVGAW
jgi:O-acetyl-ADP-ribose deacetylase (regulator of RNase III)